MIASFRLRENEFTTKNSTIKIYFQSIFIFRFDCMHLLNPTVIGSDNNNIQNDENTKALEITEQN